MFPVGNKLRIHLFGKSHAECLGCILEGFPTDFEIDLDEMDRQIALRKPSDGIGTPRKEKDAIVFEHGVKDGKTTDSTIEMVIYNGNRDSSAYSGFNITPRPGHSDLPALFKFKNYDVSGGAQFSGRMTAPLVAAGALAKQYLKGKGVEIHAFSKSIGTVRDDTEYPADSLSASESFPTRAMTSEMNEAMTKEIMDAREQKDSIGGMCRHRPPNRIRRRMVRCSGCQYRKNDDVHPRRKRSRIRKRIRYNKDERFRKQRSLFCRRRKNNGIEQ